MKMTSDRPGEKAGGELIPSGTVVTYVAHVLGGMVRVRVEDGRVVVMHPHCFASLR
jgi:hypothetical protein